MIVGALSGWIASLIMNNDSNQGALANIIIGMLGSLIGGFIVTLFTTGGADITTAFTHLNLASVAVSVLGAVVLLGGMRLFQKA